MTEKYYENIDTILDGAVSMVKQCQELGISNLTYDILADNCYDVWIQHSLEHYDVNISIKSHKKYDCYKVSKKDYSIEFSHTFDFYKEREEFHKEG